MNATFVIGENRERRDPGLSVLEVFRDQRAVSTVLLWIALFANVLGVNFLALWLPALITIAGMAVRFAAWAIVAFHAGSMAGAVCIGRFDLRGVYRVLPGALAAGAIIV